MKQKVFCLTAMVCLFFCAALPASAASDYTITDYHVDAVLHSDNTVLQTETLSVQFFEPRHGIFRSLPEQVIVNQLMDDGSVEKMTYRVKIRNIAVDGAPYDTQSSDGYTTIRIGDADSTVSGRIDYVIQFTYDIGDDRIDGFDSLFYSLNGPDWDATIENFSFSMAFETPLPQESVDSFGMFSGAYGVEENQYINYEISPTLLSGFSVEPLPAGTAVTAFTYLPEGYFSGERTVVLWPAVLLLLLLLPLLAYTLLKIFTTRHKRAVETVEFYPPNGMTSAEVGYLMDGFADDKDVLSLIIWMADKGYVTLAEQNDVMSITKAKPLPGDVPTYVKDFYNALFTGTEVRGLGQLDETFYRKFTAVKTTLGNYFSGVRSLYDDSSSIRCYLLPIVGVLLWMIGSFLSSGFIDDTMILCIFPAGALIFLLILRNLAAMKWAFSSKVSKFFHWVLCAFISLVALLFALMVMGTALTGQLLIIASFGLLWIICLLAPRMKQETAYRTEMVGKLLGLRNFIEKAELPRLKLLVEEDPSYFYKVLPYAYVFGLTDQWAAQFESLALPPPTWYYGSNAFNYLYFSHVMDRNFNHSIGALQAATANSGSGLGGSGGGGGFSGGGFGGGGGGSW